MLLQLLTRRRLALAAGTAVFFLAFILAGLSNVELSGVGLSNVLYIPVVLLALAAGAAWGMLAAVASTGVYVLGRALDTHFGPHEFPIAAAAIRLGTSVAIGWLIGTTATRNREAIQRLREDAERDFLTDLLNTRAFESDLARRLEGSEPFALLLADADNLKQVNDGSGHAAGNEYLRRLAAALRDETGPDDTVARIGGDEFVVLTAVRSRPEAEAACRRLQDALRRRGISVSFGYAVRPADGNDGISLFHGADKRLYEGKLAGHGHRLRSVS